MSSEMCNINFRKLGEQHYKSTLKHIKHTKQKYEYIKSYNLSLRRQFFVSFVAVVEYCN